MSKVLVPQGVIPGQAMPPTLMQGKGFLSGVNNFLKKTKIISNVGRMAGGLGVPYAGAVGSVAGALGYGRRKRGGAKMGGRKRKVGGRRKRS